MRKMNVKYLIVSLLLVVSLALAAGCALPDINITPPTPSPAATAPAETTAPPAPPINPVWTPPAVTAPSPVVALPSIADVVALVKPSVVAINTEMVALDFFNRPLTEQGAGSGWIIDQNGIIVTNNHVVQDSTSITVTLDDGRAFDVDPKTVFTDAFNDLAVLKIGVTNLPALKVGDSSKMRVGDWVVAVGNALGQGIRATEGIISRTKVSLPIDTGQTLYDLLETSAAINPGNSGGPLVNLAGEVIGITSAKVAASGVEGMGYAISSETALPIIQELVKNGYVTRPWLGVSLYTVDQFAVLRYRLSVEKGALVTEVAPNSPAAKAGLKAGDVIVSFAGKPITDADEMVRLIHSASIGKPIEIGYWRGKTQATTQVIPMESPPPTR
jgi:serine protease Do